MKIKFKSISIKNFLSFGNNKTTLELNRTPFSLIVGENGSGKSTLIVDALHFAIFGKIIRKGIKLAQVVNNINKKSCEVEVEFSIGEDCYRIMRGLSPDYLQLWKNDSQKDERASKVLVQKEIEELLGFDQTTFKNICILSLNNNKSFMDLTPDETRTVVENLLGIQVYSSMLEKAKVILKENKDKLKILEKDYILYLNLVNDNSNKQLKMQILKDTFEAEKNNKISILTSDMNKFIDSYKILKGKVKDITAPDKPNFDEIERMLIKYNLILDGISQDINSLRSRYAVIEDILNDLREKREFFNKTTLCPICDSVLDDKHKKIELDKIKEKFDSLLNERDEQVNKQLQHQYGEVKKIENLIDEQLALRTVLTEDYVEAGKKYEKEREEQEENNILIERAKIEITSLKKRIDEIRLDSIDKHLDELVDMKVIKEYQDKFTSITVEKTKTEEEIVYYEFIKELLSDEGIKSQIVKNDLPFLNKTINEYLKDFERTYTVKFDEKFNLTMGGYSKRGLSYFNLSEGEKKRIDIAILLAFVRLARQKNSISCNLLVFDELLETSLDEDGKKVLVDNLLTNMINDGIIENILVISHNKNLVLPDAQRIVVYKEGEFSKVKHEDKNNRRNFNESYF